MKTRQSSILFVLCLSVAVAAGAASAAGVFLRGDGSSAEYTSVRGESYRYAVNGIYAFNSVRVVAEGVGWDVVTLFLVVPAMLVAAALVARGSFHGRLLALGLFAYFFYQYLEYAAFWAFGPLFLLFIGIFVASGAGIILLIRALPLNEISSGLKFPFGGMAALCLIMAFLLFAMWVNRIFGAMTDGVQGVLQGSTTLVVQAYDLGFIVPLLAFTGYASLRKWGVSYLLGPVVAVKAVTMGTAICAMLISAWMVEGRLEVVPFAIFALAALVALVLGIRMFRCVSAK